jgi:hypothetical protein
MNNAAALVAFASWSAFLAYLSGPSADLEVRWVWYRAPLDTSAHLVRIVKVFKNGKVRIDPGHVHADPFTADAGHLDRLFYKPAAPELARKAGA